MKSTKSVTFGKNQIIYVENVSRYFNTNPMGFFNVIEYHFNSIGNIKTMPFDKKTRMQEMARICYLISHNKSIKKVSFKLSEKCSNCLLYTSPSPRDRQKSRMPSSA